MSRGTTPIPGANAPRSRGLRSKLSYSRVRSLQGRKPDGENNERRPALLPDDLLRAARAWGLRAGQSRQLSGLCRGRLRADRVALRGLVAGAERHARADSRKWHGTVHAGTAKRG